LVLDKLPVCDRLAMADVSTGWREACTTDTLHTAIGWAVLGDDATSDERRLFHWRASGISKTGGPGSVEEGRELLPSALPLAARAEVETQGRFILLVLRVVATVSRLLDGLAGGTTPMLDLQRWSEHVVAASSSRVFPSPARVRDRSPRDVSAEVVTWVWGIQLNADVVADGSVQARFDAGSVLRMAFFGALEEVADAVQDTVGRAPSKVTSTMLPDGAARVARWAAMPLVLVKLRLRVRRLLFLQKLVRAHAAGSFRPHGASVPVVRHHVHHWVRAAVGLRSGLVAQFVGGMYAVDESRAADFLAFTVAVYDRVAAAWPTLTQPRRCMHWAPVERHIMWFAVEAFSSDARGRGMVDDVAAHAACLRVRQLCVTWGWRRRSALSSPPCMPPFDSCAEHHPRLRCKSRMTWFDLHPVAFPCGHRRTAIAAPRLPTSGPSHGNAVVVLS